MRPARVLVVDDQVATDRLFSDTFGDSLTICTTVVALEQLLATDATWDAAFVDFHLQGTTADQRTGLSVLRLLRGLRPSTRLISYTQVPESGRKLYIAVAKHWFAAEAALDKAGLTPESLSRFVEVVRQGHNPTDVRITHWLAHAGVVDSLLKDDRYVKLWRRWHELSGNKSAIEQVEFLSKAQVRTFEENAYEAVLEFRRRFEGVDPHEFELGVNRNYKGVLNTFAAENRLFFAASDLREALAARPKSQT